MHPDRVAEMIRKGLPGAEVHVESEDQTHFTAVIVSTATNNNTASAEA